MLAEAPLALLALAALAGAPADGPPLRFAGRDVQLTLSEVSERTVRIELAPLDAAGQPRPAAPSAVLVPFRATEKLRAQRLEGMQEVTVGKLRVSVRAEPLSVTVQREDGKIVQELTFDDGTVGFVTSAPVLGLGEGAQQFDRRGALYPMEPTWGGWNRPVLGSVVPSPFLIGTEGWAMLVHRPAGQIDLRQTRGRILPRAEPGGADADETGFLDLFLVALDEPAAALAEYIRLTGRPAMPPRWALGYMQSHRTLAGPEEPLAVARTFRGKRLPCDAVIYLGTGYCPNGWNLGHGSIAFNPRAFARPAESIRSLHELDFKVVLHVNRAPRELAGASLDEYWARHRETFALGVDGWWPDDGDELPLGARLTRHRCYEEGPQRDRPGVRPWSLHRTGYAGSQRHGGWIWSGDIDSAWATLAAQVSVGLNCSLSLTPFWGSDTGGFYPTRELTGELYTRWFQFSTFCASFRSHGRTWKLRLPWGWSTGELGPVEHNQGPDPAALRDDEVEPICRKYLELRYRLLPYNYTLAREACDTGLPMMRATWLHYPGDAEAVKLGDQYLWGRDLLVAPVVVPGARTRRVYLPAGAWYDWWTGEKLAGGRWLERPVDRATLPLYARAGAVIPLDPVRQHTAQAVSEPTTLRVHPGADGDFTLHDDDGASLAYRDGSDASTLWIRCRWDDASRRLTVAPDARMRKWPGGMRVFTVELAGSDAPARRIELRGESVDVRW